MKFYVIKRLVQPYEMEGVYSPFWSYRCKVYAFNELDAMYRFSKSMKREGWKMDGDLIDIDATQFIKDGVKQEFGVFEEEEDENIDSFKV